MLTRLLLHIEHQHSQKLRHQHHVGLRVAIELNSLITRGTSTLFERYLMFVWQKLRLLSKLSRAAPMSRPRNCSRPLMGCSVM